VGIGQPGSRVPTPGGRAWLCAKICAGEQESAIRDLLSFYANSEAELPRELAPPIRAWIRGYVGSESELILRHLYDRISMSFTTQGSSQPGEASPSFTPRPEFHCAPAESGHRESSCVAGSCRVAVRSFAPSLIIVNDELYCGGM